ncbi:transglycosylase family protein [Microbispora sp. NRRL B-24597]|uniref:transglycosylase family protein n=2 Tax=Actinomycetes TaxID=1760 RepID=UPI00068AAA08|nr:transglycosylase family protein [Microbispora sp. NRRL B-24597]
MLDHNIGGKVYSTVYGHMFPDDLLVKVGDKVTAGQHISNVGWNGEVDPPGPGGAHLHFEVWEGGRFGGGHAVDPMAWLSQAPAPGSPGGGAPPGPPPPAPTADVVSVADWQKVADLESGGNWSIDTGNGYQGGLQFSPSTWTGNGGAEFAPTANTATPAQQMEVANRVLKTQGWGAWPVTSKEAGVTGKNPAPDGTFINAPPGSGAPAQAAPVELAAASAPSTGDQCTPQQAGSGLKPGSVPPAFEPWILKAAGTCPEVTAPLIAAQIENESNFNVNAHNAGSGADGPTQFIPGTWEAKAVDGDGDGRRDTRNIADAVMSQAAYDCELAQIAKADLQQGKLTGDLTELWLSMYNCGPGATQAQGGVCQNPETQAYVKNIPLNAATKFAAPAAVSGDLPAGGPFGGRAVAAAMKWRGTTYAWGGGNAHGPTKGVGDGGVADSFGDYNKIGFDCSGLMIYAIAQASNHTIVLDHYTTNQLNDPRGKPVPLDALQPGDVVFPAGSDPQHVAMFIGNGHIVEAPQSGDVVKVSPLSVLGDGVQARRFG